MRQRVLLSGSFWNKVRHPIRAFKQPQVLEKNRLFNATAAVANNLLKGTNEEKMGKSKEAPVRIEKVHDEELGRERVFFSESVTSTIKARESAARAALKKHAETKLKKYIGRDGLVRATRAPKNQQDTKKLPAVK
ncbi:Uncharacterised protein [uncultured archaeon]|nr:Uncharacterised protein [uncultured archaeon]